MSKKPTVAVGMSGGVDSSVSAYLLKKQGYNVVGLFMKNWEEKDSQGVCKSSKEYDDVVKVCDHLGISCYSMQFVEEYQKSVFSYFLEAYKKGFTPNPDILCNKEIKFKAFLQKALNLGADYLATGHYAQILKIDGKNSLVKGIDSGKDQSYFLYTLTSSILEKVLFPIGHLPKKQVREIAKEAGICTHDKKDSTGICFIGKRDFKPFLNQYLGFKKGNFETLDKKVIGTHDGVAFYTIGQRKGLKIGGKGEAWFVVKKDLKNNVVMLAQGTKHPALYSDYLIAEEITWVNIPSEFPLVCKAKNRYRQEDQDCILEKTIDGKIKVSFSIPQRAITIGQSVVFYSDNVCLGGGIICEVAPSYYDLNKSLPSKVSL